MKRINILVVGQTGVGKSAFINYLSGQQLRASGVGKPVTKRGFFEEIVQLDDQQVKLIDSWGVEQDKVKQWEKDFKKFLQKHTYREQPKDWLHAVIYIINAASSRVEPFDIEVLKYIQKQGHKPIVVFSKSHAVNQEDQNKLKSVITRERKLKDIPIIFINAVEEHTYQGKVETFGREEVILAIINAYNNVVREVYYKHIDYQIDEEMKKINKFLKRQLFRIKEEEYLEAMNTYVENCEVIVRNTLLDIASQESAFQKFSKKTMNRTTWEEVQRALSLPFELKPITYLPQVFKNDEESKKLDIFGGIKKSVMLSQIEKEMKKVKKENLEKAQSLYEKVIMIQ